MDALAPPESMATVVEYENPSLSVGFGDKSLHPFDVQHVRRLAEAKRAEGATSRHLLSTFQGIRIELNFDLIDGSDSQNGTPLQCTEAGQQVPLSSSTGTMHTCTDDDVLTAEKKEYLKSTLMAQAEAWLEGALQVNPVQGSLPLPMYSSSACTSAGVAYACCSGIQPISSATGADFVLFVTARPTSGFTIAWALSCANDQYGRPTSGARACPAATAPWRSLRAAA